MCLVKVAENYYDHLPAYMEQIFGQTAQAIKQAGVEGGPDEDERIGLQALEFWSSVCEEEAERVYEAEEIAPSVPENPSRGYMAQVCPRKPRSRRRPIPTCGVRTLESLLARAVHPRLRRALRSALCASRGNRQPRAV